MASPVTETEYAEIATTLHDGATCGGAARKHGRSKDTIRRIARDEGVDFVRTKTKNATQARIAYAEERRLEIIGKGFDKAEAMLEGISEAADFQKWSVALGTLVDKARLETGEATSREEQWNGDARDRQFSKLFSQLDAYRTGIDDGHGGSDRGESVDQNRPDPEAVEVSRQT